MTALSAALPSCCKECNTYQAAQRNCKRCFFSTGERIYLSRLPYLQLTMHLPRSSKYSSGSKSQYEKASFECRARLMTYFISDSLTTNGLQSICWTSEKVALMHILKACILLPPAALLPEAITVPTDETGGRGEIVSALTGSHSVRLHEVSA